MLFNSIIFGLFFPVVFLIYWLFFQENVRHRNVFLWAVSYIFYGWWDWRFLGLIAFSSLVDFYVGQQLATTENKGYRKYLLGISIGVNLGLLGFFKYFNFFLDSLIIAFDTIGLVISTTTLSIILPVGISFYTFQTLSYTLDIYHKKMKPTQDIFAFLAFVSFFPQLVAGPIERAKHLLPQFSTLRTLQYDKVRSGLLLMAWGLFKKLVIADRLAIFVSAVYQNLELAGGWVMVMATIFFAFQVYLDFSAYSDIAIGCARTLGFDLSTNFRRPYLAMSFSNFWQRWHISLSSWFKDYVYIPLGGNKGGEWKTRQNLFLVFLLSGLWHGASWNFVLWGGVNALFLIVLDNILRLFANDLLSRTCKAIFVFFCWTLSLIFFRAKDFSAAIEAFSQLGFYNFSHLYNYPPFPFGLTEFLFSIAAILGLLIFEMIQEQSSDLYTWFVKQWIGFRWTIYVSLILLIIFLGAYGYGVGDGAFIYFQF